MSQSDYIQFKKTTMILKNNTISPVSNELPPVLTPELYTAFTTYNLETTVSNTKNSYSRLLPSGKRNFLDIEKTVATCPSFILCTNTNNRPNRVKNTTQIPSALYRWKKTSAYKPSTCDFKNGYVMRRCLCSKIACKCKTTTYPSK